jgi:hypothetical protein
MRTDGESDIVPPLFMKSHLTLSTLLAGAALSLMAASSALAGQVVEATTDYTRYGLFDALDHRSVYGKGLFPEPFTVDESDLESEIRFDWSRVALGSSHTDMFKIELEKSIGVATFEIEVPYIRAVAPGDRVDGVDNIDLGVRLPLYQYVTQDQNFDFTVGVGFEWGIAPDNNISRNGELVPKVFFDTMLFKHFSIQAITGVSFITGPGEAGGEESFEYGAIIGYNIEHKVLPIPGVQRIVPMFEISGEVGLNHDVAGQQNISGFVGARLNLNAIGPIQPRFGAGYLFPINDTAREDFHSGVYSSFVFEF